MKIQCYSICCDYHFKNVCVKKNRFGPDFIISVSQNDQQQKNRCVTPAQKTKEEVIN